MPQCVVSWDGIETISSTHQVLQSLDKALYSRTSMARTPLGP